MHKTTPFFVDRLAWLDSGRAVFCLKTKNEVVAAMLVTVLNTRPVSRRNIATRFRRDARRVDGGGPGRWLSRRRPSWRAISQCRIH